MPMHSRTERRCAGTGEICAKAEMIRFVRGPDGELVPDIGEKLPGRGVWVQATREAFQSACKNGGFKRGLKSDVRIDPNLENLTERLLKSRVLALLTMALKGRQAYIGFDQVKSAAQSERLSWRVEASDGSEGGRGKIRALSKAVSREFGEKIIPVIGCFSSDELGAAFGRESIVHAVVKSGHMNAAINRAAARLAGFCELVPQNWPDKRHETAKFNTRLSGDKG